MEASGSNSIAVRKQEDDKKGGRVGASGLPAVAANEDGRGRDAQVSEASIEGRVPTGRGDATQEVQASGSGVVEETLLLGSSGRMLALSVTPAGTVTDIQDTPP